MFDFSGLFATYSVPFSRIPKSPGSRDYSKGGQWVEGMPSDPVQMTGIIVPITNDDLRFDAGGTYTKQDKKIYVMKPDFLVTNDEILFRDKKYRVMEEKIYEDYANFNIYIVRRMDIGEGK